MIKGRAFVMPGATPSARWKVGPGLLLHKQNGALTGTAWAIKG